MTEPTRPPGFDDESLRAMAAYRRIEGARRRMDEDAFRPSSNMERLVLQVIGGWEQVRAQVNFNSFTAAGPDAEWAGAKTLANAMYKLATAARVRYPHEEWSTVADEANRVRQRFAHMLYIGEIEGEYPNRTLKFGRLGRPGEPYSRRGEALGLRWRDDVWTQQDRFVDALAEQELRDTLEKEQWLIFCSRAVHRLGGILADSDLADDHKISEDCRWLSPYTSGGWWIPWMLPEWVREKRTTLYVRDVRLPAAAVDPTSE